MPLSNFQIQTHSEVCQQITKLLSFHSQTDFPALASLIKSIDNIVDIFSQIHPSMHFKTGQISITQISTTFPSFQWYDKVILGYKQLNASHKEETILIEKQIKAIKKIFPKPHFILISLFHIHFMNLSFLIILTQTKIFAFQNVVILFV